MSKKHHISARSLWLGIGAAVLIVLLIIWLTVASLTGDTDVAASLPLYGTMI